MQFYYPYVYNKNRHQWQIELVEALLSSFTELASTSSQELTDLIKLSFQDLSESMHMNGDNPLQIEEVSQKVIEALNKGYVGVTKINSENQISALLDRNGQLRLDNPFNIFIGGQILDRGITIDNLIGFLWEKPKYISTRHCFTTLKNVWCKKCKRHDCN